MTRQIISSGSAMETARVMTLWSEIDIVSHIFSCGLIFLLREVLRAFLNDVLRRAVLLCFQLQDVLGRNLGISILCIAQLSFAITRESELHQVRSRSDRRPAQGVQPAKDFLRRRPN